MSTKLPEFERPPVVEVAISIQFDSPVLDSPQVMLRWSEIRDRFPKYQIAQPMPRVEVAGSHFSTLVVTIHLTNGTFGNETLFTVSSGNKWFMPTLERMLTMTFHSENLSTGAKQTEFETVKQLLNILWSTIPDNAPPPSVVPTWLGGAQAEWHRKGVDLEISVNPGEPDEYYFNNKDDEQEGSVRDNWAKLKESALSIV